MSSSPAPCDGNMRLHCSAKSLSSMTAVSKVMRERKREYEAHPKIVGGGGVAE